MERRDFLSYDIATLAWVSGFCVNDRFDYLSTKTLLTGNDRRRYLPFEDAPVKGKFDYKGLFINFAYGVETAVVLIMLGAAEVVLAPALMCGGISALVTTINMAKEDFASGNVRSAEEAEWLINRESLFGIAVGAVLGPLESVLGETEIFSNKAADISIKGVIRGTAVARTGIEFRRTETLGMRQLTPEEKIAHIYNWKTIALEFGGTAGTSIAFEGLDMAVKGLTAKLKVPLGETSYGKSSLKFGDNDLVYGPSANGKLKELKESAGGKLLSDVGNPYDMGYSDWLGLSLDTIENTVKQGNYIHFDLTNMQDIDGILNGTSQYIKNHI